MHPVLTVRTLNGIMNIIQTWFSAYCTQILVHRDWCLSEDVTAGIFWFEYSWSLKTRKLMWKTCGLSKKKLLCILSELPLSYLRSSDQYYADKLIMSLIAWSLYYYRLKDSPKPYWNRLKAHDFASTIDANILSTVMRQATFPKRSLKVPIRSTATQSDIISISCWEKC